MTERQTNDTASEWKIAEKITYGTAPCEVNMPRGKQILLELSGSRIGIDIPFHYQSDPRNPVYDGETIQVWMSNPCNERKDGLFLLHDRDFVRVLKYFPTIERTTIESTGLAERILLLNTCYPHNNTDKDNTQVRKCLDELSKKGYVSATIALANAHMYRSNEIREGKGSVYLTEDEKSEIQQEKNSSVETKKTRQEEDYQIIANYHEKEARKYGKQCDDLLKLKEEDESKKKTFHFLKESVLNNEATKSGEDLLKLYLLENFIPTSQFQPSSGSTRVGCATFFIFAAIFTLALEAMTNGHHPYICYACGLLVGAASGIAVTNHAKRRKHHDASHRVRRLLAKQRSDLVNG